MISARATFNAGITDKERASQKSLLNSCKVSIFTEFKTTAENLLILARGILFK